MIRVPDRKFLSEFAVNLFSVRWLVVSAAELASGGDISAQDTEVADHCHIYLICRRPYCSIDPKTFSWDNQLISGHIVYRIQGVPKRIEFSHPFRLVDGATGIRVSAYPHREIETFDAAGNGVRRLPADALVFSATSEASLRTLEVLYVGQAYADGNRSAIDRLRAHSTLQQILAETSHTMPDDQILLLAFEYVPYRVITIFDGIDKKAIRDERDTERFYSILDNPLSERQQICLAEAGLIRYFQPKYNEIYKTSFPAADQKVLDECYQLDFSALVVEIDTTELTFELYSTRVASDLHHIAQFDLVDPRVRRSFTFISKEGKTFSMPDVIAPSRT